MSIGSFTSFTRLVNLGPVNEAGIGGGAMIAFNGAICLLIDGATRLGGW